MPHSQEVKLPESEMTAKDIKETFLMHALDVANIWAELPDKTPIERTTGTVFTLLATLDGVTPGIPAMDFITVGMDDADADVLRSAGLPYVRPGVVVECGNLHHEFATMRDKLYNEAASEVAND